MNMPHNLLHDKCFKLAHMDIPLVDEWITSVLHADVEKQKLIEDDARVEDRTHAEIVDGLVLHNITCRVAINRLERQRQQLLLHLDGLRDFVS